METNSKIFLNSFPVSGIRNINKKNLLNLISRAGTISRSQLANISGLTPPSVSKITRVMIQEGILVEQGTID
jgi:DNA-binding MarR family transcriptional regulator